MSVSMFAGEKIFITGATGFMGKVLVEKILRSCPDVDTVFLLIREKKGKSDQDRLQDVIDTPLFETIRTAHPESLRKLVVIPGDCAELRLGLSPADEARLVECVSVVFHAAATVRFDEPLDTAILLNTRGTREAVQLAKAMKHLKVFEHVSTTFCHPEVPVLQEETYQCQLSWKTMIALAEKDAHKLRRLLRKITAVHPNSYTFTKALAEDILFDSRNDIPVVICRPAVVINSLQEPIPGWIDNLNGPFPLFVGISKGLVRVVYGDESIMHSITPVDWAIRGMILAAWARMNNVDISSGPQNMSVVNLEFSMYDRLNFKAEMHVLGKPETLALWKAIRPPKVEFTLNYWYYWTRVMTSHVCFGIFVDIILQLGGNKPRLLQAYRRMFQALESIRFFMPNEYPVGTGNVEKIEKALPERFRSAFTTHINSPNALQYERSTFLVSAAIGLLKYVFKENLDIENNKKHFKRLYVYQWLLNITVGLVCIWLVSQILF